MSLSDFWSCSLWEFAAAIDGWNRAQAGDDKPTPMSAERYDELIAKHGYSNG